jgi:hypothetical protein
MGKNVTIPLTLLKRLVALLEYWDISLFERNIRDDYWDALCSMKMMLLCIDIREAYARITKAPNEDARKKARTAYLQLKNQLSAADM